MYEEMYAKFKSGEITKEAWLEYCQALFDQILEQHKEVFVRLKFR
jgi:hypothetical protein